MAWGMGCYNCPAQITGNDSVEVDNLAIAAGWQIGLMPSGQAYYSCPECAGGLLGSQPLLPARRETANPS